MNGWRQMRAELRALHPSLRWLQIDVWRAMRKAEASWLEAARSDGRLSPRQFREAYECQWKDPE